MHSVFFCAVSVAKPSFSAAVKLSLFMDILRYGTFSYPPRATQHQESYEVEG